MSAPIVKIAAPSTKITVQGWPSLDPVTIDFIDHGPGQGEITLKCWGEAWTMFWGAMGKESIVDFVLTADDDYLFKKLSRLSYECSREELSEYTQDEKILEEQELKHEAYEAKAAYLMRVIAATRHALQEYKSKPAAPSGIMGAALGEPVGDPSRAVVNGSCGPMGYPLPERLSASRGALHDQATGQVFAYVNDPYTPEQALEFARRYNASTVPAPLGSLEKVQEALAKVRAALEADAADLWKVTDAIKGIIKARRWVTTTRGAYEWNDERYKEETAHAFKEVMDIIDVICPPASKRYLAVMAETDAAALSLAPGAGTGTVLPTLTEDEKHSLLVGEMMEMRGNPSEDERHLANLAYILNRMGVNASGAAPSPALTEGEQP